MIRKWRCSVCGYIHEGEAPPDQCPVCGADKSLFEPVGEAAPIAGAKKTASAVAKWRCTVCGYVHEGPEPPDKCPVCGADKSLFEPLGVTEPAGRSTAGAASEDAPPRPAAPSIDLGPPPETPRERFYQALIRQMLKHHAHPMSVHIPNGVLPLTFVFMVLAAVTGCKALETAAYVNLIFVALTLPLVLFSGYIEWKKRYRGFVSMRFLTKILSAAVVATTAVAVTVWWTIDPHVLRPGSCHRWIFMAVNAVMLGSAGVAGFIGGKLVFKD